MANIFETARAERRANKFSKGLDSAAGLAQTLSGPGPFTIFVPTDAAFDQLSDDQLNKLLGDPGKLTKLLQYQIVPGIYTAEDMLDHIFLKTLEGQRLRMWADIYETPLGEEEITENGPESPGLSKPGMDGHSLSGAGVEAGPPSCSLCC